jgi:lysophospholipase L1-like esterase
MTATSAAGVGVAGPGATAIAGAGATGVAGAGAAGVAGAGAAAAAGSGGHAGVMSPNSMTSVGDYHPCPTDGTACKIMPFGDSITDGYNQDTPGGYRVELFRLAHAAGKNINFVGTGSNGPDKVDGVAFPHNHEGHSGWTIAPAGGRSGVSTLVSTVMPQHTPHIVLLMIGTNDAIDNYEMAKAPTRLGDLIDAIYAQLPDVLIVVASLIPARGDRGQGDDAELNARIQSFNASVPQLVKQRADTGKHIVLVDMHKPFEADARSLLEDQWHPNLAGYVLIGAEWFKALQPQL